VSPLQRDPGERESRTSAATRKHGAKKPAPPIAEAPAPAGDHEGTGAHEASATPKPNSLPPTASAPHPIYYSDVQLDLKDDPPRIDFVRAHGADVPPADMRALRQSIEDVARMVRIVFQNDRAQLQQFFTQLHITAWSGLVGDQSSVDIGMDNLGDVKASIADAFPAVRGRMWTANLKILLVVGAVCGAASAGVIWYYSGGAHGPAPNWYAYLLAVFLIPIGVAIGLFVEFVLRVNDDIPYDQLIGINPGRWKPVARAVNTLVVAYVFAALLAMGAFKVGVGNLLLNDFTSQNPGLSVAIGFVTGFAFPYVRDIVQKVKPTTR
jgi:hypothetical protein